MMSPPLRYQKDQQNQQHQQNQSQQAAHQMVSFMPQTPTSLPSTPIQLYPTGAAALIPAPPTYELIPNRIFVGGFPTSTTETELREHFEKFFAVKDVKMVKSLDGQSKGYGFITFETEDQAEEIRKLTPKQLEFRSRKLNLGPAIRKINSNSFQPSYAIATPSQLVAASPGPFSYAIPASPSPYSGYSYPASPQMFVYPPLRSQDQSRQQSEQQTTPQNSPTNLQHQQSPQVFFGGDQDPIRSYASAVAGVEKSEVSPEKHESVSPQPLLPNQNVLNTQYSQGQQQWNSNVQQQQQQQMDSNNGGPYYNENYSQGYTRPHPYQQFAQSGVYMNSQGMYHSSYSYMTPPLAPGQYPQMMSAPYWQQQQQHHQSHAYAGYNPAYNNWVGPSGDMNQFKQNPSNYFYQNYPGNFSQQHTMGNNENTFSLPLQAPRQGKKSRKPSECQDKKTKSPIKGARTERPSSSASTPDAKYQKNHRYPVHLSPLSASLQSLAISSPTKNN
uniref:DAZ protein 1 n=2 Tax=Caenorhabditis elegans TaxID=6239 RepID=DAZ1_CAEEL|nr:RecName: Full=DAZ protein 1 [Caenorhabditis elegans]BAA88577.1 DAZ-1 [Caenorhabditis elegans]